MKNTGLSATSSFLSAAFKVIFSLWTLQEAAGAAARLCEQEPRGDQRGMFIPGNRTGFLGL